MPLIFHLSESQFVAVELIRILTPSQPVESGVFITILGGVLNDTEVASGFEQPPASVTITE